MTSNKTIYPLSGGDYVRTGNDVRQVEESTKPNPGKSAKARQAAAAEARDQEAPATGKRSQAN